tara:strand:+ start:12290 stop:12466 length:177 start_codon:yes stop_codon:yes gene_type:complete
MDETRQTILTRKALLSDIGYEISHFMKPKKQKVKNNMIINENNSKAGLAERTGVNGRR